MRCGGLAAWRRASGSLPCLRSNGDAAPCQELELRAAAIATANKAKASAVVSRSGPRAENRANAGVHRPFWWRPTVWGRTASSRGAGACARDAAIHAGPSRQRSRRATAMRCALHASLASRPKQPQVPRVPYPVQDITDCCSSPNGRSGTVYPVALHAKPTSPVALVPLHLLAHYCHDGRCEALEAPIAERVARLLCTALAPPAGGGYQRRAPEGISARAHVQHADVADEVLSLRSGRAAGQVGRVLTRGFTSRVHSQRAIAVGTYAAQNKRCCDTLLAGQPVHGAAEKQSAMSNVSSACMLSTACAAC